MYEVFWMRAGVPETVHIAVAWYDAPRVMEMIPVQVVGSVSDKIFPAATDTEL